MGSMKLGAAYIRVSTAEQTELSPDSQLKLIMEYAKKNDIILSNNQIYADEGISGRNAEKRPAFMRMIAAAKSKPRPFDVILVWKFSRFARNREDSIVYKSMLRKQCGIEVISISEPVGEDKTAMLMEALFEAMDEYYSLNLAEEVKRGMREKASRGGIISKPPLGYVIKDGIYTIESQEADIIKEIFKKYLDGASRNKIACELNAMGIKTKNNKAFLPQNITYILTNPVYIGKMRYSLEKNDKSVVVEGEHMPIISDETFEAAQNRINSEKKFYPTNYKRTKTEYYFRGIVRCSDCGSTLTRGAPGYLQCCKYSRGQCAVSHNIKIDNLRKVTITILQEHTKPKSKLTFTSKTREKPLVDHNNINILNQIKKEYQKLERIKLAFEDGIDTIEEYKEKKTKIQSDIDTLKGMITENVSVDCGSDEYITNFKGAIAKVLNVIKDENATPQEFNEALYSIIDNIVFDRQLNSFSFIYKIL